MRCLLSSRLHARLNRFEIYTSERTCSPGYGLRLGDSSLIHKVTLSNGEPVLHTTAKWARLMSVPGLKAAVPATSPLSPLHSRMCCKTLRCAAKEQSD